MRISDWSSDVCSSDLVENERFGQGRDFGGRSEAAHRDAAACTLDIAHHLAEVAARFDVDRVILPEPLHREGVLVPAKRARRSEERRVGKESVSTCRSRGSACPKKKKEKKNRDQ